MRETPVVLILGCGYTGARVAALMLEQGFRVVATARDAGRLDALAALGVEAASFDAAAPSAPARLADLAPPGCLALHSIPTLAGGCDAAIVPALAARAARLVYLSTTGVYGAATHVDESTPPQARSPRERLRLETEDAVRSAPCPSLILRPAAIYGPGRGIQVSVRDPAFRLLDGGANFISRIHVDDLARHAEAALLSTLTGAYPVADEEPCSSAEIARFCASLQGLPAPESASADRVPESRRSNRRVDGSAVRRLLGLRLLYPSYRQGIPAALAAEKTFTRSTAQPPAPESPPPSRA